MATFTVKSIQCLRGCAAGLSDRTAWIDITISEPIQDWDRVAGHLQNNFQRLGLLTHPNLWDIDQAKGIAQFSKTATEAVTIDDWLIGLIIVLQRMARIPVLQGQCARRGDTYWNIAVAYDSKATLTPIVNFALRYFVLMCAENPDPEDEKILARDFERWWEGLSPTALIPSTYRFALAAKKRGIPCFTQLGVLRLGQGKNARRLNSTFTDRTSNIGVAVAKQKAQTNRYLLAAAIPVPESEIFTDPATGLLFAKRIGFPVVVKPSNLDQGVGVVPDIRDEESYFRAFENAMRLGKHSVIVEKHVWGDDHRLLVVGGRFTIATKRTPGGVMGDGLHTVAELVAIENNSPHRGEDKRSMLISLRLDEEALICLSRQELQLDSIPASGQFIALRRIANISAGGTATDVTDLVHPDNKILVERAARVIGLDIAGIDFICPDIARSWREVGGAICEVNAQPGLRVHWLGDPQRDLNGEIVDWLFADAASRIPTTAISGTNGKTTTSQMMHQVWMAAGKQSGVCTTQGTWIGRDKIHDDNLSGLPGANLLFADSSVEAAVIELPRKGLLGFGHPADVYDVAALLNVQNDHIGEHGISSLEQMASLKAQVLERATRAIVVNADDPLCMAMLERSRAAHTILISRYPHSPEISQHVAVGHCAIYPLEHDGQLSIAIHHAGQVKVLMPFKAIPATMNGLIRHNEMNAMFAVGMAIGHGIALSVIKTALSEFQCTVEMNPGRFNFISGFPFQVLLDYAHNPDGIRHLCELLSQIPARRKILASYQIGNRSAQHLREIAPMLAGQFEHFILGQNRHLAEQCPDYQGDNPAQIMLDFYTEQLRDAGISSAQIEQFPDDENGIKRALSLAQAGDLVVVLSEEGLALPHLIA
ncbi:Mur ligase family protein [Undibacterium fentianense]|uniref:ATP-grasp domain-containing protein n=1 Tax=Undibacterium fentianense TaxID=2828728 RepID=A0A941IEU9_9BURK|nr:Mur ligase family protein [Undibacterium fentianense]MBR7801498.1 hypothetical protein [Undibacterium fentianense]